jgi:hypothetical protein
MKRGSTTIICGALALSGCTGTTSPASPKVDAGVAPASASAECGSTGQQDAASFTYTATCAFPVDDAGVPPACQEWSESPEGDWSPFIASCLDAGGTITTVPCQDAGLSGTCSLAPECTDQTTAFYYGAAEATAGRAACVDSPGATFSPAPPP